MAPPKAVARSHDSIKAIAHPVLEYKCEAQHTEQTHLSKRFTLLSTIAFAATTMNSWIAFSSALVVPLTSGGGPTLIYGLIIAGIAMSIIATGFAELASAYPSAGGQYHIVYMIFPPATRRAAAFFTGWVTIIAIMAATASCSFFVAGSTLNLVALWTSHYIIQNWHVYLVHIALCTVAAFAAARFPKTIGHIGVSVLWLSIMGFVASMATLLAVSEVKQPSSFVFKEFHNSSGWVDGWAFIIGVTNCLWAYCGIDAPIHISEEVVNPSRNIPIAIGVTMALGIVTVVVWNICLMFVVTDLGTLLSSGIPILEVYHQALNSKIATTIWAVYYIAIFYHIVLNLFVSSSRIIWSLSRDGGIPYSSYFSHLHRASPVRAMAVAYVLQVILGVLYIASTTAYSSFVNLTLFALNITVVLPQATLLLRGRDNLPARAFSLGKYGYFVNALATIFTIFFAVCFAFPFVHPVTGNSMNYLIVVFAIGVVFTIAAWFFGLKRRFTGPLIEGHM